MSMRKAVDGATKPKRAAPKAKVSSLHPLGRTDYDAPSTPTLAVTLSGEGDRDPECRAIRRIILTDPGKQGPDEGKHR